MRKANLIFDFVEIGSERNRMLCTFQKTIEIADVPPLGYTVLYPEDGKIAEFFVQRASIQNKSGNMNLHGTMEISQSENWDYARSLEIISKMKEVGWEVKLILEELQGRT